MRNLFFAIAIVSIIIVFNACSSSGGNDPGSEYMPDMYHSIAYEANLEDYYYYNTWGSKEDYYKLAQPRKPVAGTIPRGYAGGGKVKFMNGSASNSAIAIPVTAPVPYYYKDTEEERTRATNEIINNPFPITAKGLEMAKPLYEINCGICHGNKGDGNGWLVDEKNLSAAYPAQPANFLSDEFVAASNGRYYHAIMHGKNVMGGYADKLSYEERWQVIHYIRSLQAKDKKLEYNDKINTLNSVDMPKASSQFVALSSDYKSSIKGSHHHDNMDGHEGLHHHQGHEGHEHGAGHGHGHEHSHDGKGHSDGHSHDGDGHSHSDGHSHEGDGHSHSQKGDADGKKKKKGILKKAIEKGGKAIDKAGDKIKSIGKKNKNKGE